MPIKEIFLALVANGTDYPMVSELTLTEYLTSIDVFDENLRFVDMQIAFVASNVEMEGQ